MKCRYQGEERRLYPGWQLLERIVMAFFVACREIGGGCMPAVAIGIPLPGALMNWGYFSSSPLPLRSSRFSSKSFLLLISSFFPPFLSAFRFLNSAKSLTPFPSLLATLINLSVVPPSTPNRPTDHRFLRSRDCRLPRLQILHPRKPSR